MAQKPWFDVLAARFKGRVAEVEAGDLENGEGVWFYLKPGWISPEGTHSVVERDEESALSSLRSSERCSCDDCKQRSRR